MKAVFTLCFMYLLPKDVGLSLLYKHYPQNIWFFIKSYLIYQRITNFSNELHINTNLWHFLCRRFSQNMVYKLNFSKNYVKILNELNRVSISFSQFLLHLLSIKLIQFEQKLLENWTFDGNMYRFNDRSTIRSWIITPNLC